jgi:hypothetical protein
LHEPDRYSGDGYILELTPCWFRERFLVPGGVSKLLLTCIIYSCYYPPGGALALTALALLLFLLSPFPAGKRNTIASFFAGIVPATGVLFLIHFQDPELLAPVMAVSGALAASHLYQRVCGRSIAGDTAALFVIIFLTWHLFAWGVLLFVALTLIHGFFARSGRPSFPVIAIVCVAAAGVLFPIETKVIAPENAMRFGTLVAWPLPPLLFYLWFILTALMRYILPERFRQMAHTLSPLLCRSIEGSAAIVMTLCIVIGA